MMEIRIDDDFDLNRIACSGQCFRWEKEESGDYRIIHGKHLLRIRTLGNGRYGLSSSEDEFQEIWKDYFDLDENYQDIRHRILESEDPFLFRACEFGKGIRILKQDLWEILVSFIISQNKNIPAIKKSIDLLCTTAGRKLSTPEGESFFAFPSPEEILSLSNESLAACRLGYRCRYVKAAAEDVVSGKLNLESLCYETGLMGGEEERETLNRSSELVTIQLLTSVYGVGAKVANCVSLFGLHHLDAFPEDVWIRRILANEYPNGYPKEKYSPYNGVYQQYMFYYYRENS